LTRKLACSYTAREGINWYRLSGGHSFVSKALTIHLSFDPAILLLGIYSKKIIVTIYLERFPSPNQNWNQDPKYATMRDLVNSDASMQWNIM
jgi:hypothetical protein